MKRFIIGLLASIGGLVLFSFIAILVLVKGTQLKQQTIQPNTVLFLEFTGGLAENSSHNSLDKILGRHEDSLYHIVQAIDQASNDPHVKGIVARLDNASMGLAQAQEIRNAIMRFRVLGRDVKKFTIAHADTFGESGPGTIPYYLGTAFEEIWLQPLGDVSMTGLYVETPFAKQALDELGIKAQIGKREEFKTAYDSLTETGMSKPNKESLQSLLNSLMNQVVRDIALSRELNETDVWDAVNKGPLFGNEALKLGIIDRLDYYDEIKPYANSKVTGEISLMKAKNYLMANPVPESQKGENKIALIYGDGMIIRGGSASGSPFGEAIMGSEEIKRAFEKAIKDEDVVAIVFRINSPGGSPVASETVLRATRKAQQAGKPVIVSMSDLAGSGGYWIASFADRIVAHPSTITGSIGVIGGKLVTQEAWAKLGVNWENVHVGENAGMWSSSEDYSVYGKERQQASLDNIYNAFIDRVSEGRKLPREHVLQIAKGRVWSGEDALKFGLVDKLGDLKEAIELAKETASLKDQVVPVEIFPKPKGFGESLQMLFMDDDDDNISSLGVFGPLMGTLSKLNALFVKVSSYVSSQNSTTMSIKKVEG
jgi:protease-4